MQKLRQQLKYLQAELCARAGGAPSDEVQVLCFTEKYCLLKVGCLFWFGGVNNVFGWTGSKGKNCLARGY